MNHKELKYHPGLVAGFFVFVLFSCICAGGDGPKRSAGTTLNHVSPGAVLKADGVAPTPPPRKPSSSSAMMA